MDYPLTIKTFDCKGDKPKMTVNGRSLRLNPYLNKLQFHNLIVKLLSHLS